MLPHELPWHRVSPLSYMAFCFLVSLVTSPPSNIVVLLWKRKVCAPPPCFLALLYDSAGRMGNGAKFVQLSLNCGMCSQELRVLHEEIRASG